ncbi:BatA domain-containing protein [Aquimarina sp. Aq107]|uniref:BatA domain-containing protein n=1 Tax=Aquimarina sp. Aq107 TaxID=1191912 RepID=UPI000D552232|nr:BatA domain-containing protein [Aquimarina sp. Aq107]
MSFLYPTYLWALLGLLVPLVIHLWSKNEGKTIKVGSTKLLSESDSKQSRSIQLNEFFLLILRMLLIGVLVLLLAGFQMKKKSSTVPVTYIISPKLVDNEKVQTIIDTIEPGSSLRLLQTGFPELDPDEFELPNNTITNYWQLAREMETLQTDSIVVLTDTKIIGLKGARPEIAKNNTWISINTNESIEKVLQVSNKGDSLEIVSMTSDQHLTSFRKEWLDKKDTALSFNETKDSVFISSKENKKTIALTNAVVPKVMIIYTDSLQQQKKYVEASLNAISKYIKRTIDIEVRKKTEGITYSAYDLVVWLSTDPVPSTTTKLLAYKPDIYANTIIEPGSSNTVFYLTASLNRENSITKNVSERLLELFDFYRDIASDINTYDKRSIDISELEPVTSVEVTTKKSYQLLDISKWLWLLLAFGLIAERSIAKYRKQ